MGHKISTLTMLWVIILLGFGLGVVVLLGGKLTSR